LTRRILSLFLSLILSAGYLEAGGPLIVTGTGSPNPGQAFEWDVSKPIRYTVDGGPLSTAPSGLEVISNSVGITRVDSMFQNWQSVPTTAISYSYAGKITAPGLSSTGDIKTIQDLDAVMGTCNNGSQNPIIFDADGSLLHALGLDPLLIGFSGACELDMQTGHIRSAFVVLNGEFQDGISNSSASNYELSSDQFDEAITHEMGHFSGLDHSQINLDMFQSGFQGNCPIDEFAGLPLMFPIEFCQSRKSAGLPVVAPDDAAWISTLYPNSSYAANYGTISGFVFFSDGITHVQGLNVIARRIDDPLTPEDESQRIAFSVVSGFEFTGNPGQAITGNNTGGSPFGSRNPALVGYFEVPVTPGSYTLKTENIDSSFTEGSSVGPLDPPGVTYSAFEFWHQNESAFDNASSKDPLTVQAGQKLSNINFILNQTYPRFDQFEDGEVLLTRPTVPFVFRGTTCRALLEKLS
jgi:hypothetical protein